MREKWEARIFQTSLVPNQPIRFDPLKFRGLQIILYQLHQTLFRTFLPFFLRVQGGSGADRETSKEEACSVGSDDAEGRGGKGRGTEGKGGEGRGGCIIEYKCQQTSTHC